MAICCRLVDISARIHLFAIKLEVQAHRVCDMDCAATKLPDRPKAPCHAMLDSVHRDPTRLAAGLRSICLPVIFRITEIT